jgi:hypothetical protein
MAKARHITIVTQPSNDRAATILAVIGFVMTIVAALICAAATIVGALIVVAAESKDKLVQCCCVPKDDWKEFARANGWIPRGECPWDSVHGIGTDLSGKKIEVKINTLADQYRWVLGSSSEIGLGKKSENLTDHIRGLYISTKATTVVAVGMASVEGDFSSQSVLAEERTDRLTRLIKDELKPTVAVHGLSLGRYVDERTRSTEDQTAIQRRVVIVEVFEPEKGANLSEAVYDALVKAREEQKITFDVREYKDKNYTNHGFGRLP